nr:hypothetical protein [Pseudoponticoccus marisrubri]
MKLRWLMLALVATVTLSGCDASFRPDASPEEVARFAYRHDGPPEIVLYTMINNRTGNGAHSSMLINAPSQRVVFDPAGSVALRTVPEVDDVLYGVTPEVRQFYESAHARSTYHVRIQSVRVAPEVAEMALRLAEANGPAPASQCALSTSGVISRLPGFESVERGWFPNRVAEQFARIPGVTERKLYEDDDEDKEKAVAEFEAQQLARLQRAQAQ